MIYAAPGAATEIVADNFATGLTGTIGYRVRDNQGADSIARATAGITEDIAGSGIYRTSFIAPGTAGQYTIVWDSGGAPPTYATEDLVVTYTLPAVGDVGAAYASLSDVQARAGALQNAWAVGSKPSTGDIVQMLADVAAEIDAYIGARGLTTPAVGPAAAALKNVNADGALVLALEATYPEGKGPASASEQIDVVRARYDATMVALADGSHPAVMLLESGNVASRASSFWENEPLYGIFPFDPRLDPLAPDANPYTAPTVARGQSL
jgi:hypothetical protein